MKECGSHRAQNQHQEIKLVIKYLFWAIGIPEHYLLMSPTRGERISRCDWI